jgi:hypothetical protein
MQRAESGGMKMVNIVQFCMTDVQWSNLNSRPKLSSEARCGFDIIISNYLAICGGATKPRPNWKTHDELKKIAKKAEELSQALADPNTDVQMALVHAPADGRTPKLDALRRIQTLGGQILGLSDWCTRAADALGKQRPGSDPSNLWWLVEMAAGHYNRFNAEKQFNLSKECKDFILKLVELADPTIGQGSIDGAIRAAAAKLAGDGG